jgi:hypothetical protein
MAGAAFLIGTQPLSGVTLGAGDIIPLLRR